jgi:hypothetical protein
MMALLLLLGAGPRREAEQELRRDNLATEATDTLRGILKGIAEGDYELYSRDFSENMKRGQSRDEFLQLQRKFQRSLGKFKSMDYLGYYLQYGDSITLFKARFTREKHDVLIKLVLDGKASHPVVTGLWFDSPSLSK